MAKVEGWKADFGIIHFEGKPVGLVQVQTRKWLPFLTTCRIYRGPLWIYDEIPGEMLKLVLGMIRQRYQLRRGQPLMFHPELPDDPATRQRMSATGFRRWSEGYESVWLDLTPGPDALHVPGCMASGATNCARLNGTTSCWKRKHRPESRFDWLMEHYLEDKIARNYRGPSPAFLRAMHGASADRSPLVVLRALHGGKPVAGVLLVRHGRAATYQVGWTDERGRAVRAHHFLLWQSCSGSSSTATPALTWAASTKRRRALPGSRPAWGQAVSPSSAAMSEFPRGS